MNMIRLSNKVLPRSYAEYRQVHEQMREMLTVRANMEQMLKQDEALKEQERSRANVR